MKRKYLIRLDDACPTMDALKWRKLEYILDMYEIKPMVGIIPHNENLEQFINHADAHFWEKVKNWQNKGWVIALHGYNHCYTGNDGMKGLNPMWERSEFAGLPLEAQREKIRRGIDIMMENEVVPQYFFAPSHTFDENTLIALIEESSIRIISDTIALKPYKYKEFVFIPQIIGAARRVPLPGLYTFCYHPNTMTAEDFERLETFIKANHNNIVAFQELKVNGLGSKGCSDRLLTSLFFLYRRLRKLK